MIGGLSMNKHTVYVAGKHFVLLSDDKDKYVDKLASEVNEEITRISLENPTLDRRGAAVLCALNYADDKYKEASKNKSMSESAQPLINQADKQAKQIKELTEILAQRDDEIKRLQKELSELRDSFAKSTQILDGTNMTKKVEPVNNQSQSANRQNNAPNKGYKPTRQYSLFDDEK